jgi:iron(III) transport system permease protein
MFRRLFPGLAVVFLLAAGLLPVLSMLWSSITESGTINLSAYSEVLNSVHQWRLMGNSFTLAFLVTLLTLGAGVPLGIILGKTDLPLRKFITAIFVIPLLIPPYIIAVSWFDLLGREGLLGRLLSPETAEYISVQLFGLPGCTLVLFSIFLPVPLLLTIIFIKTINPELEEAGRLAGGWKNVLRGITLPLIYPAILLSAILVFLLTFGEFSVPNFLRYEVFPVESFTQFSAFYNFKAATAAALPLAGVTLILLFGEAFFLRDKTYRLHPLPESKKPLSLSLGKYRYIALFAVTVPVFLLVIIPLGVLLIQAGNTEIYSEAAQRAGGSILRSIGFAAAGATLLTILGFFTGYLIQTRTFKLWRSVDTLTIFLFALPGTVTGIGLISLWNTSWSNFIYATPLIILLGYTAKYTALTSRITVTQLGQIPSSMEDAARISGAGWLRRMVYIIIPLARRGLLAGWIVGFIFSLRDTGITMLVYPPGYDTLPIRIMTLMANGSPRLIAALSIIMIIITLLPAGIIWILPAFSKRAAGT